MTVQYSEWTGVYLKKWTPSDLNEEAFSHPAKMGKGLVLRIFEHAIERGYLIPGQTVIFDPFGGQMSTAYGALKYGCPSILIELEQNFFDIGAGCDCTGVSDNYHRLMLRPKKMAYTGGRHLCPACISQLGKIQEPPETIEAKKKWDKRVLPLRQRFQKARARLNHYKALAVKEYYERKGLGKPSRLALKRELMLQPPLPLSYTPPVKQPFLLGVRPPQSLIYERNSGKQPRKTPHHYVGNVERWQQVFGGPKPVLIRGNSMELASLLESVELVISSPYGGELSLGGGAGILARDEKLRLRHGMNLENINYGSTPSQLGAMSLGSPTFGPTLASDDPDKRGGLYSDPKRRGDKNLTAEYGNEPGQMGMMTLGSPPFQNQLPSHDNFIAPHDSTGLMNKNYNDAYGDADGQLSVLSLGSPSWAGNSGGQTEAARNGIDPGVFARHQGGMNGGVGQTEGNIGAMPIVGIGSPPFLESIPQQDKEFVAPHDSTGNLKASYGTSPDQLGNANPTTFWSASETIIRQMAQIMPPGSISIWVTGDFITNGKRYEFSRLWAELCEYCGYELIEWIRAWKINNVADALTLEGGKKEITKGGVSFFRGLVNKKHKDAGNHDLVIEWEDVLILRKL